MTHPFWKKHNPSYFALTFAVWGVGLGLIGLFILIKEWLKG